MSNVNVVISNPADRKKIRDALQEINNSMTRIAGEKDFIKEAIAELSKNFEIDKKTLNRMAKVYHKQSFMVEQQQFDDFETLYSNVVEAEG